VRLEFTLDCSDLDRTAKFWQAAVGFVVDGRIEGRYVSLRGHGVILTLQRVAEPKTVKNRMHMDLLVPDLEREVDRLETIGASRVTRTARREFGETWFVLTDQRTDEIGVPNEGTPTKSVFQFC
jgi:hypothetical protein